MHYPDQSLAIPASDTSATRSASEQDQAEARKIIAQILALPDEEQTAAIARVFNISRAEAALLKNGQKGGVVHVPPQQRGALMLGNGNRKQRRAERARQRRR